MKNEKEKTYPKDSLKGTFLSVLTVGGIILLAWFIAWNLFISRM
ncbi:cytochrome c oxidase subunit 2A [Pseudobacillus badius]|nr:cytochrome c oxidase subunit 2A [Bacillus badius]MED0666477.1 cytochrome c oxidase subunit 2A [Bacillus badius]TDW02016.1 hypothetical protein B0G66_108100 [Bacillus badius]UAT29843.1 cytochrome c oxidase subunit 2A [Bacillus badius]GLY10267.1 hypothetical protein Bbad01_14830 [Bacillus badius]